MSYKPKVQWDEKGRAYYRQVGQRACTGSAWSKGKCEGRWEDEYGSAHWCSGGCVYGNGVIFTWTLVPIPEFNAPEVPAGWKP